LTDLALLPPNDPALFVLIIFVFGTFEDLALADFTNLDLNDLLALVLPDVRLFKTRVWSPVSDEAAHDLRLPLPVVSTDLEVLTLGTFEDFPLMLLAFLILKDLLVAFKLFADFKLLLE
jgi:hypothetical protein